VVAHGSGIGTPVHARPGRVARRHREAVVIAADDLDALEETLDLLSDPAAVREIAEAREAATRGEGIDLAEVRRRYLGRSG
jgi:antitoxin YefM